jgi:pimeloyl-ACP methyl ester carboxylesterase
MAMYMKVESTSYFKNKGKAERFFRKWVYEVSKLSGTEYKKIEIETSLGKTMVWGINTDMRELKPIVIFPGFRTSSLFWDMDNTLAPLKKDYRIYLVETNGQPNLSDGNTPDIKNNGYGIWANEVLEELALEKAIIAGTSFGGLVCLKLCIVKPARVEKAILLNPGCLQPFSLSFKNIYYNLLPLFVSSEKNVEKFLDKAVFYKDNHIVSPVAKKLITSYELFAIKEYKDRTQKPYAMKEDELKHVDSPVYLLLGDKDILFPYKKSVTAARRYLKSLKSIKIIPDTGHGIETSLQAMNSIAEIVKVEKSLDLKAK